MAKQKFTFKTDKPTGRYSSFFNEHHTIKIGGKNVGSIGHDHPFRIHLMVTKDDINSDGNPNCPWRRVALAKDSETLQAAKDFLNAHIEAIKSKFKLHPIE